MPPAPLQAPRRCWENQDAVGSGVRYIKVVSRIHEHPLRPAQRLGGRRGGSGRSAETELAIDTNRSRSRDRSADKLQHAVVSTIGDEQVSVRANRQTCWRVQRAGADIGGD